MLENLNLKQKIIFFSILSIMITFIIYYVYINLYKEERTNEFIENDSTFDEFVTNSYDNNSTQDYTLENPIIVYVCGAVKENKNVSLKNGSRISDAIEAAGGLTKEADLTNINLAYILEDGEKVYIPKLGEGIKDYSSNILLNSSGTSSKTSKININKASQTQLETLPGVGPSTALKIINYRKENGNFTSIEDIKNVDGIGDSKYEKIKDYIVTK